MTERDIVQRLRETIVNETPARYPDVIEAAITEIERLRTALKEIADMTPFYEPWADTARKALGIEPYDNEQIVRENG